MTLRQLTRTQIQQLVAQPPSEHTAGVLVTVHAVLTRLTYPTPTVIHDGEVTLYLQFNRARGKRGASEPSRLTLFSVQSPPWAEYHIDHDVTEDGSCVVEDYHLVLFSPDGQGPEKGGREAQAEADAQAVFAAVEQQFAGTGIHTVTIGDHARDVRTTEPNQARCTHPPLCPFGSCGTMLCPTCGTFYSTCHHAVAGAEEDVLVECDCCETLVWVPVSRVDEPAFCPEHTGDPSEPGHPDHPRSDYDGAEDDAGDGDEDAGDPSEPGHPDHPRSSYDLPETQGSDAPTPNAPFISAMLTTATAAFRQHRLKDLEAGPLAAFVAVAPLIQQAWDLPCDQLARALQAVEARHAAGAVLVDAVVNELDADMGWAAALTAAGATADMAEAAQWLIQRARFLPPINGQASAPIFCDRIRKALEIAEHGSLDGADHKMWVIDQMVRALTGCPVVQVGDTDGRGTPDTYETQGESEEYRAWVQRFQHGEDGPDTYVWDTGSEL